ncbi:unnamed protein product [Urochloa humidicola]
MLTTAHSRQHHAFEKSPSSHMKNLDRKLQQAMNNATSKYMQRIYPLGIQRSSSNLTLSSLSLSQNSNDSSLSSSNSSWEPKVPLLYGGTFSPWGDVMVSLAPISNSQYMQMLPRRAEYSRILGLKFLLFDSHR